jgi:thermostable 8-oxoguanine DNA glycosylase
MKEHIENTYPGVTSTPMYNLDGERGKVHILTSYSSMGEYQKIGDQMDKDEKIREIIMRNIENLRLPEVDHFYRGIS